MRDLELLSKADVLRQYRYPEAQLDKDLKGGGLPHFKEGSDRDPSRYYIPRVAVEQRIRELTGMKAQK